VFSNAYKNEEEIMSEKNRHSKQTLPSETSRRTFLKTGAAAAGAALLGAALKATPTTAADQAQDKEEVCQALFVQDAKGVELKKDSVILKEPNDRLIFFCDRPKHEAGFLTWDAFIDAVSTGENSFADNPPNAALSILDKKGQIHELVLFLIDKPVRDATKITFPVEYIIGDPSPIDGRVIMFIDPIGRPLSPTSVAGVHRRHRRRHVRHVR
jgi:TAT (twin-arginine translocation) pathway signal sequence